MVNNRTLISLVKLYRLIRLYIAGFFMLTDCFIVLEFHIGKQPQQILYGNIHMNPFDNILIKHVL